MGCIGGIFTEGHAILLIKFKHLLASDAPSLLEFVVVVIEMSDCHYLCIDILMECPFLILVTVNFSLV